MNTKHRPTTVLMSAALAGALAVFAAAAAGASQQIPKEGKFAIRNCWSGVTKVVALSKTQVAYSFEFTGESIADEPGTLFDHQTFQCEGMGVRSGKKRTIADLVCVGVDPDGDRHMDHHVLGKDGQLGRIDLGGTGKYEGMVSHAKLVDLGPFPRIKPGTFQGCNHEVGTYKLK
jgi:hypothetical protein